MIFLNIVISVVIRNQKQPSRAVLGKRCSENMQQIYRRTPMPKCDFNKVALQVYCNRTSAWVFSCKFAAYFQNTFLRKHLWMAASEKWKDISYSLHFLSSKNLIYALCVYLTFIAWYSNISVSFLAVYIQHRAAVQFIY